jgi:crotonobetainyl-CoA:carnitine CoA-transferase CaiB-like acyl-CoA transferase
VREWFAIRGAPLRQHSTARWLEIFGAADIASKPCHTLDSLRHDPHLAEVGLFAEDEHPTEGRTIALRSSVRVDDAPLALPGFSQPKGWASRKVLSELGFDAASIDQWLAEGAIVAPE